MRLVLQWSEQIVHAVCEGEPGGRNFADIGATARSQPIIFSWVARIGFNPFGLDKARSFEPIEQRIDRPLGNAHSRNTFQPSQHLQSVKPPAPQRCEYREVQAALSQLHLPLREIGLRWLNKLVFHEQDTSHSK